MMYSLKCGNCLTDNNVSAALEPIGWLCNICTNDNSSSLPRNAADKTIVTDSTKAKSILSAAQTLAATNVVQSRDLKASADVGAK